MADELKGIRVAVLAADGVEQVELEQPWDAVSRAGAQVVLVSLHEGQIQAMNHDIEPGARFEVDAQVPEVSPSDFCPDPAGRHGGSR
jgi:protease I